MDRETARQEIRREWRRILPAITAGEARQKVNGETSYICPLCGHGTHGDGLTRNPQSKDGNGLKCFGCSFSGDVIDLYQQTTGKDHSTALEDLAQIAGVNIDAPVRPLNRPQRNYKPQRDIDNISPEELAAGLKEWPTEGTADYTAYYEECRERITDKAATAYLNGRDVLGPAIYCGVGFDPQADPASAPGALEGEQDAIKPHPCPRIIIPCSKGHYVARSIDPKTPKQYAKLNPARSMGAAAPAIFHAEILYTQDVREVFITEGAFDALSVISAGGEAIALNSTSNARALIETLEKKPTAATLIICLDNDKAGGKAAQVVQEGLQRLKLPFITADITGGYKDPNEALVADRPAFLEAVQDAIAEARAIRERQQQERQQRTGAGMIDAFLESIQSRKYEPVPTGIADIDAALYGGFTRQTLILLGAAPGAGKTALAQWIFEGMAKRGTACLYLNLEMSRDQILARSISRIAAQNGDKITPAEVKQGYKWDAAQEIMVKAAAEEYKRSIAPRMIYNPDGVGTDLDGILAYIEEEAQRAEAAGDPAPLVVLDYLQIITGREREEETSLIKRAVASFKNYAIKHNTIVFCIIAHNRAANQSGTVTQESGRDTSALEYSADLQLGLAFTRCLKRPGFERKAKEDLTPEEMRFVTLKITKGRDARIGAEVDLFFNGESMTYTQLAREFVEEPEPQPRKAKRV